MLNQRLQQKLLQKLSPQQILLMKLLQIPSMALEQRIKQEIEENPVLEIDEEYDQTTDSDPDDFGDTDKLLSDVWYVNEKLNEVIIGFFAVDFRLP